MPAAVIDGKAIAANENCELAPGSRIRVGPMRFVLNFDKQADQIAKDPDEAVLADQVEVWDELGDVDDTQDDITVAPDPTEADCDTERLDDEDVAEPAGQRDRVDQAGRLHQGRADRRAPGRAAEVKQRVDQHPAA